MKKRKNIIISAITCLFSICLMMFGVYAASNPSVSISGRVSYSARDAKVLVLGKVNGQAGNDSNVDYPTVADATNPTESAVSLPAQYLGYTKGESANDNTDNLPQWNMGTTAHAFYEDSTGIRPIVISFKMTNLSNYPVVATVDFTGVTEANLASKNLTRTTTGLKDSKVYLDKNVTKEISVTYSVANDAVGVNGDGLLNMSITFEKTVFPTPSNTKSQQGETMQSDWEYTYNGNAFSITGYKKAMNDDCPANIVVPSSVVCTDGKSYPVDMIGVTGDFSDIMEFAESGNKPIFAPNILVDFTFNQKIQSVTISEGIKTVGVGVFAACAALQQITFPETITELSFASFMATGLQSISLPNSLLTIGNLAFNSCEALSEVIIPENVTTLGDEAFSSCTALSSVTLPSSLSSIGDGIFGECSSLQSVTFADGTLSIKSKLFKNLKGLKTVTIPSSVKSIGAEAFSGCTSLSTITIPNGVKNIETETFSGCSSLSSITIPNTIESISDSAFYNCTALSVLQLPEGIKSIANNAFAYCTAIKTIQIPNSVQNLSSSAFRGCKLSSVTINNLNSLNVADTSFSDLVSSFGTSDSAVLSIQNANFNNFKKLNSTFGADFKSVILGDGVTKIPAIAFRNWTSLINVQVSKNLESIGAEAFYNCKNLTSLEIPNGITNIEQYTFYNCTALKTLILPNSINFLGQSCFSGCSSLETINIPDGVNSIEANAFLGCSSLTSIQIPSNVTTIGDSAFSYTGLTSVTIPSKVEKIGKYAFRDCKLTAVTFEDMDNLTDATDLTVSQYLGAIFSGASGTLTIKKANFLNFSKTYSVVTSGSLGFTNIAFEDGVSNIPAYAFIYQKKLANVTFGKNITSIGDSAFAECYSLTNIVLPEGLKTIGKYAFGFAKCLTSVQIPSSIESISDGAFRSCYQLAEVINKSSLNIVKRTGTYGMIASYAVRVANDTSKVETVGDYKFVVGDDGVNYLTGYYGAEVSELSPPQLSLTLPTLSQNYSIKFDAFYSCRYLKSVVIPEGVTEIGITAFYDCSSLDSISLPNSLKNIGSLAFYGCDKLKDDSKLNNNGYYVGNETNQYLVLFGIKDNTVTSFNINSDTKFVLDWAFLACSNLESVNIPEGVIQLGEGAFSDCTKLNSIELPESILTIGTMAFSSCENLKEITIKAQTPPTLDGYAFQGCKSLTAIYVPSASVADYKAADGWKEFASKIQAIA